MCRGKPRFQSLAVWRVRSNIPFAKTMGHFSVPCHRVVTGCRFFSYSNRLIRQTERPKQGSSAVPGSRWITGTI